MRITLGHKLAVVVGLLGLVAAGISGFALRQSEQARQRAAATEAVWDAALQARTLAHAIEHAVVRATDLYTAGDTQEARTHLAALQEALAEVEQARGPFLAATEAQLSPDRKRRLDLAVKEFLAYQTETAEMGLTISPKAALIQATDEATVKNRERMVAEINGVGREVLAHLGTHRRTAAEAERHATLTLIGAPALALVLGLAAAFWIIATQVQRPLDRLRATMRDIAAARLDGAVPFTARRDEVGEMAHAIEAFRADLIEKRALDAGAAARNARDAIRVRRLAAATEDFEAETGRTVADLAGFAATMQGAADVLSEAAGNTTAQAARVAAASNQSAGLIHGVASAAEELSSSARVIVERVRRTGEIATLATTDTQRLETVVASLSRAAGEIDLVVTLIRAIAEQTNLLALNATIEAARAGPAGRGFAVVAAEVKALAGQTAAATDRITGQIAAIQSAADGTVSAIGTIGHTIAQMNEIAADVAVAAEQQGQASQEIASAIARAATDVHTVSESIGAVQTAAASSEAWADQVRGSALRVSTGSHHLRSAIETFLRRVHAA